jgi:hypothetical protein
MSATRGGSANVLVGAYFVGHPYRRISSTRRLIAILRTRAEGVRALVAAMIAWIKRESVALTTVRSKFSEVWIQF